VGEVTGTDHEGNDVANRCSLCVIHGSPAGISNLFSFRGYKSEIFTFPTSLCKRQLKEEFRLMS
jgi:hypothetical protein